MQPSSLISHRHSPTLITMLRDERSPDELLNEIFLDIAFHLSEALDDMDIPIPRGLHSLIATLRDNLVQVNHTPGRREINVCNRSLVFVTYTTHISPAYRWQARGRFAGETAIAPPRGAGEAEKQIAPWLNHTGTHWQIMILDWLARYLTPWLAQADIPSPEKQARKLASQATQSIISNTQQLNVILTDAAGLPRDLLAYLLSQEARLGFPLPITLKHALCRHWHQRQQWPGRSAKQFPLAAFTADTLGSPSPSPHHVRDTLINLGLTRKGWAHLQRFPASLILHTTLLLDALPDTNTRTRFLETLSFWMSRLGKQHRYYTINRQHLQAAMVWLVHETALLGTGQTHIDAIESIFPAELTLVSVLIHRRELGPESHLKLRQVFLTITQHLLTGDSVNLSQALDELAEMLDWLTAEIRQLPLKWFNRSYTQLAERCFQWHQEQLERQRREVRALQEQQRRDREAEQERERILEKDETQASWPSPLPQFETNGLTFRGLLNHHELQQEGIAMQHCVGTYTAECFHGNCLIYSVIHKDTHIGTLEMVKDGKGMWRAAQFKGRDNRNLMHTIRWEGHFQEQYSDFSRKLNHTALTAHII